MVGGAGLAGLLALIGSAWELGRAVPRVDFSGTSVADFAANENLDDLPRPLSNPVGWSEPIVAGYDLFAPTPLRTVPASLSRETDGSGLPGLRLREIEPVPFRVQLAGHVGSGAAVRGIFSASDPPMQRLLAAGDDWGEQAFEVQILGVVGEDESGSIVEAEIWDRPAHRVLRLREGEPAPGGTWRARVEIDSGADSSWLEPGESFGVEDEFWTLESISPDPPEIRISRQDPAQPQREFRHVPLSPIPATE